MPYFRVGSFPEVKQLPPQARQALLQEHVGLRFYVTLLASAGIVGAIPLGIYKYALRSHLDATTTTDAIAVAVGLAVVLGVYLILMARFRLRLRQAMMNEQ